MVASTSPSDLTARRDLHYRWVFPCDRCSEYVAYVTDDRRGTVHAIDPADGRLHQCRVELPIANERYFEGETRRRREVSRNTRQADDGSPRRKPAIDSGVPL